MSYTVTLRPAARRALKQLDRPVQKRIAEVRALTGAHGFLRVRVGDYRIIYTVDDDKLVILVLDIGHRSVIYRNI